MKYGFLLTHGPLSAECESVLALASAAAKKGIDTELFVMVDGGYTLSDARMESLAGSGVKVTYCFHNAEERKSVPPEGTPYVQGGIPELSGIMAECDRFFSF
ncbi:MAG: DsrE family protein [Candidatus Desulfatibia sp.]|uniref:DsrE family protein n=1 Tax=Candidatus Desulfatibia sp. TaxID=3101189 RepID=UPI002F303B5A